MTAPPPPAFLPWASAHPALPLAHLPVGIIVTPCDSDSFLYANPRFLSMTLYDEAELRSLRFADLLHSEHRAEFAIARARLARHEVAEFTAERRCVRRDGRIIWLRMTECLAPLDDAQRCISLVEDVSASRGTSDKLNALAAAADSIDNFVAIWSEDLTALFVNRAGRALMGLESDEEVAQTRMPDYFAPEELPRLQNSALPALQREGRWWGDVRLRHFRSGELLRTTWNIQAISDDAGRREGWATISPDLRRLKLFEERLRRSELKYRSFFENLRELVVLHEPVRDADGHIVDWIFRDANRGALQVLGERREELNGRPVTGVFGAKLVAQMRDIMVRVFETGEPVRFEGHRKGRNYQVSIFRCDDLLATSALDITDRKQAELALRRSEQRLRRIIETSPIGIALGDAAGRIVDANDAYLRLVGSEREELTAGRMRWDAVTPSEYAEQDAQALARARREGVSPLYEKAFLRPGGARVPVLLAWVYLGDEDNFLAFVLDITARKQAEEKLREADRRKDEFLAMLAHELRNPLAAISNAAAIMTRVPLPDARLQRAQEIIERQTQHLARLVDDLLDVSRITRGKVRLRQEEVLLGDVLSRAVETARPLVSARHHQLSVLVPPDPLRLRADEMRLAQVFTNILNNAAKYTPDGGSILVTASAENGEAVVRITDSGIGIAPALLPRVFDLFTQAERGLDRAEGGLGIGLTIVKNLVVMHGGSVQARSAPGQGTTMEVRLPLLQAPAAEDQPQTEQPAARPLRILVVDDDADGAESLAVLLRFARHDVETALSADQALQVAVRLRPDVLLLDIGMPGADGYELARRLRMLADTRHAKLIALSGYPPPEGERTRRETLFDHYVVKPVDIDALNVLLAQVTARC